MSLAWCRLVWGRGQEGEPLVGYRGSWGFGAGGGFGELLDLSDPRLSTERSGVAPAFGEEVLGILEVRGILPIALVPKEAW